MFVYITYNACIVASLFHCRTDIQICRTELAQNAPSVAHKMRTCKYLKIQWNLLSRSARFKIYLDYSVKSS